MNIDREIEIEQENIKNRKREQEEYKKLQEALKENDMLGNSKIITLPNEEMEKLFKEAKHKMTFSNPKIVRIMPDGNVYVREAKPDETPDTYTFDTGGMYFFNNGLISNPSHIEYARTSIINTIAKKSIDGIMSEKNFTDTSWAESMGINDALFRKKKLDNEKRRKEAEKRIEKRKEEKRKEAKKRREENRDKNIAIWSFIAWNILFWVIAACIKNSYETVCTVAVIIYIIGYITTIIRLKWLEEIEPLMVLMFTSIVPYAATTFLLTAGVTVPLWGIIFIIIGIFTFFVL